MAAKKAQKKSSGPPSAKLARFGVPIPPRIAKFFDGPELAEHADVKAWGLAGFSGDTKVKVQWGSPRLASIYEYATDGYFEQGAQAKYLPIAALGSESYMFAVDVTEQELPVYFFDYEEGFSKWADSFDAFLGRLLRKGQRTPAEKLEKAYDQASKAHEKKDYKQILTILEPVIAEFPKSIDDYDLRETVGAAHNLMGIAYEHLKEIPSAMEHYEIAVDLGTDSGGLNVCDLLLDHFKDYPKLVTYGEKLREGIWAIGDNYGWFHIRNYLGMGYLLTGRPRDAIRAYHQIQTLVDTDPDKLERAIKNLKEIIADRPETDKASAESILAWLGAQRPPLTPEKLAAFRSW